jgi:hypothetical protein
MIGQTPVHAGEYKGQRFEFGLRNVTSFEFSRFAHVDNQRGCLAVLHRLPQRLGRNLGYSLGRYLGLLVKKIKYLFGSSC